MIHPLILYMFYPSLNVVLNVNKILLVILTVRRVYIITPVGGEKEGMLIASSVD